LAGWVAWAAGLYAVYLAAPQERTILDIVRDKVTRGVWDEDYLYRAAYFFLAGTILCVASVAAGLGRNRRGTDRQKWNQAILIGANLLSLAVLGMFVIYMGF
jgi:hypothetical protein